MSAEYQAQLIIPPWVRHSKRPICTIDIHPSGDYFATGGWDNYCKIWSFSSIKEDSKSKSKLLAILHDHSKPVNCVRFSPDGKYLATCSDDSIVFLWQRIRSFGPPSIFGLPKDALEPNSPTQRWSSKALSGNTDDVTGVAWYPDSQKIASCSISGTICVWDIKNASLLWSHRVSIGAVSISIDPLSKFVAVQLMNGKIAVFDTHGRFIKEIGEEFSGSEQAMVSRICWTPDGSFVGTTSGWSEKFVSPFFQRESFNFAFMIEGHVAPTSCISASPLLYRNSKGSYSSLIACADKNGVVSCWMAGSETGPLFILSGISKSIINDISWSSDGKWIAFALESDPLESRGGALMISLEDFNQYEPVDDESLIEIKSRLLGENSFRLKSSMASNAAALLRSIDIEEKDIDLEVLQLTTQEVLERQIEIIEDGQKRIQPVLLTSTQKQLIAFQCSVPGESSSKTPIEYMPKHLKWPKPAALSGSVYMTYDVNEYLYAAYDVYIIKLSKSTGRRLSTPFYIGTKCKHISHSNESILVVGEKCYIFDIESMKLINSFKCPTEFTSFCFVSSHPIIITANYKGRAWLWDQDAHSWVGGAISEEAAEFTIDDIEFMSKMEQYESSASQWFDFGISTMFYAYLGQDDKVKNIINDMENHNDSIYSNHFLKELKDTLRRRWPNSINE